MLQINSLLKFSAVCPFLGHSTTSSLRNAASTNILTTTAMKCPMMGPKLAQISYARTYASVAGTQEVEAIHKVGSLVM
jgi:5-aminolevulinate synthase